jgi:hypothetical protein
MRTLLTALLMSLAGIAVSTATALPHDPDRIGRDALDQTSYCAIGRKPPCSAKASVERGLFQTGLHPRFAEGVHCRDIDSERYAIDYTYKRNRESYHGGIDMPAPFGTPIVAAAAGTVVGIYRGEHGHQGIHVILRHTPQDTGLPIWVYTVYAHLNAMPKLHVGDHLRMGDLIGPTGNSGQGRAHAGGGGHGRGGGENGEGRRHARGGEGEGMGPANGGHFRLAGGSSGHEHHSRRPALHFGVYYSESPKYAALQRIVIPADAHWMDPVALFRTSPPFDSKSMRALPAAEKAVPIPYMLPDGSAHPADTKLIWPYRCTR